MPQDEDKLLEDIFQKYKEDDSEEGLLRYILETVFNELLEKEMTEHIKAQKYEQNEKDVATETATERGTSIPGLVPWNLEYLEIEKVTSLRRSLTNISVPRRHWYLPCRRCT